MRTLPYGSWPSPITADTLLAETSVDIALPRVDGEDLYWLEARASDGGRSELVRRTADGRIERLTPAPWNVRSRVHEYGGGSYGVRDGVVVFAHVTDLRLYRLSPDDSAPVADHAGRRPPVRRADDRPRASPGLRDSRGPHRPRGPGQHAGRPRARRHERRRRPGVLRGHRLRGGAESLR